MRSWVNGHPADGVAVHDRGLAYGDGLFETIRVIDGSPRYAERHLRRLARGCQRLSIPCEPELLGSELQAFARQLGDGVAKLILTRGAGQRGYGSPDPCHPTRLLLAAPAPAYPDEHAVDGVALYPCTTRLAEQPLLAGLKHLNRLEQVFARAEWRDTCYAEGLMRDTSGRVIEGVFSNLFMVVDGQLTTAGLDRCGVAGIMRERILEIAVRQGWQVDERDIEPERLWRASEVFCCNSQYGIWPVRSLQTHAWPVGPITRKLQSLIAEPDIP
ncbi:aminodeoxychorismate lyase [Stutzerimonas nosocomialis]|uniref:aminodeoxychorismate lyase n=1 Tax=Stutzerimonas nosocomialis TaxID=1056496 RepID=UPI0011090374|nr:aminodeoxychorismate lyase [Stutzerimonas nosocomialis]TLX59410.1 aminodeoxychorismate lyase [Stutzerimonas nosocomialis]